MRTQISIPMPTGTSMPINSSLKHGQSWGTEMCNLCTLTKNAAVIVPNFSADFCNPCKRLKHSVQHKECFLRRVSFYCYCLPPYGGRYRTRSKNRFVFERRFFLPDFGMKSFRSTLGMSSPISGVVVVFCSQPSIQTKLQLLPKLVCFSGVASVDSEGIAPNSVHRWPSAQLEWEPAFARTSTVERPASFFAGEPTEPL